MLVSYWCCQWLFVRGWDVLGAFRANTRACRRSKLFHTFNFRRVLELPTHLDSVCLKHPWLESFLWSATGQALDCNRRRQNLSLKMKLLIINGTLLNCTFTKTKIQFSAWRGLTSFLASVLKLIFFVSPKQYSFSSNFCTGSLCVECRSARDLFGIKILAEFKLENGLFNRTFWIEPSVEVGSPPMLILLAFACLEYPKI